METQHNHLIICISALSNFNPTAAGKGLVGSSDLDIHMVKPSVDKRHLLIEITYILTVYCSSPTVFLRRVSSKRLNLSSSQPQSRYDDDRTKLLLLLLLLCAMTRINNNNHMEEAYQSRYHNCLVGSHDYLLLFTPSCCSEGFYDF